MEYIFVGHSSFYMREGWLKKGVEYIKKYPQENAFSKSNIEAIDRLGIGSVMVQSLKFWMTTLDVMKKDKKRYILKREIEKILEKDPYLQNTNILWLLHMYIMEREEKDQKSLLWEIILRSKKINVFTIEQVENQLNLFLKENNLSFSKRSIKDSITTFIKTYYTDESGEDPENNMYSPFVRLDYLKKEREKEYIFRNISSEEISEYIPYYLLCRRSNNINKNEMDMNDFYEEFNSIIRMKYYEYEKLISKLQNRNLISVDRAAGLSNIIIIKKLDESEIIGRLLESE
ncbi:DUF4007 family protein [uncultured Ilyobacter sp.]|uniref:DUF4007 family protein n=1 Tax=uncultured Ilyobacter sp. TaxID=544433 RepID=UPI0029F51792|nr:DUF4007 family protein [uncultured Ilyobacter sp.]